MSIKCFSYKDNVSVELLLDTLRSDGIVVVTDYFSEETINLLDHEVIRLLNEQKDKVEILDKEGVSKDKRLFHAEKYSILLNQVFANNQFFHTISQAYSGRLSNNKKTLINLLEYDKKELRNSGAGWHRDNHDCQFKAIMYLTDVDTSNGNFQWITNSSKRHIGKPEPRTKGYDTRFFDSTIEKIIKENENCKLINVTGKKGTIIFADTTYIHRGNIIRSGARRAITQYFFR